MKTFKLNLTENPSFNTVINLTNKTFDPDNFVSGRGATEDQLKILNDYIKEYEGKIGDCDNPQDALIQALHVRIDLIEAAQKQCCANMSDDLYIRLSNRLDDLEQAIEDCCAKCNSGGGSGGGNCDGSTVTVSFGWNGSNPQQDGGQASAVSSGGAAIAGYYFIVSAGNGIYVKKSTQAGWSINGSGVVTLLQGGAHFSGGLITAIGAVDANGCEGMTPVNFPINTYVP